jgi:DNA repair exonuclease SbcCD ATPase subunit
VRSLSRRESALAYFSPLCRELDKIKDEHQKIDSETQVTQSGIRQLEFETVDAVELIKRVEATLANIPARIETLESEESDAKAKILQVDRELEERQSSLVLLKKKRKLETQLEHISQREALIQELAILTNEQRKSRELVARGLKSVNSIKQRADKVLRSIELGVTDPTLEEVEPENPSNSDSNDLTHDDLQAFEAQLGFDVDNQLATELESKTNELEHISSEIQSRILQHRTTIINQLHQVEEQIRAAEAATKDLRQRKTRLEDEFAEKTRKLRQELDLKQKHQSDRDRLSAEYGQKQTQIEQKRGKLESLRAQATQCFVRINSIEDEIRQRDSATKQRREQIISKVEKWKSVRWRLAEAEQQVFRIIEELKDAQSIYLQRWTKMNAEQREGEKAHLLAAKTIQKAVESTSSLDSLRLHILGTLENHVEEIFQFYKDHPADQRAASLEATVQRMIRDSRTNLRAYNTAPVSESISQE